jgi:hypothetical protein
MQGQCTTDDGQKMTESICNDFMRMSLSLSQCPIFLSDELEPVDLIDNFRHRTH